MNTAWYIDDHNEMIRAVGFLMKLLDFEVKAFLDASSASQALEVEPLPDLVLLDIHMPEISGMDMLEFLRRKPKYDDLPVVMVSSDYTDLKVLEAYQKGADGYLIKPVSLEELDEAINIAFIKRGKKEKLVSY